MNINFDDFNSLPQQVAENKKNIEEILSAIDDIIALDIPTLANDVELLKDDVVDIQEDIGDINDTLTSLSNAIAGKQDTLISGTNIKTINNESLLGSGNIEIQGGGGGLTEIVTDDIYFSTFFNTYPDGVYILSATAQNTPITIHLGVDDLNTETIPFGNPNQKMLMFVNNEYQINPYNANIKWKGITIINGGGANSVYDIRQRIDNANIHIFNVVNNLPATVQDLNTSKFDTIFGNLDIPQFLDMYQPENKQNNKYILMPDYQQNFDITNGTGSVLYSLEYGEASSSIVMVTPYTDESDNQYCTFNIIFGNSIIIITYDYTNDNLIENYTIDLGAVNEPLYRHDVYVSAEFYTVNGGGAGEHMFLHFYGTLYNKDSTDYSVNSSSDFDQFVEFAKSLTCQRMTNTSDDTYITLPATSNIHFSSGYYNLIDPFIDLFRLDTLDEMISIYVLYNTTTGGNSYEINKSTFTFKIIDNVNDIDNVAY